MCLRCRAEVGEAAAQGSHIGRALGRGQQPGAGHGSGCALTVPGRAAA